MTGIILDFPRLWDNKCRCQDLDTFFKVFHANLNWLEIHIDMHNIGSNNILSQLFKNNKQLCDDLSKTEAELPFDQLLKKFNCENKCLPQIKNLVIDFEKCVDNDESCLSKLLNNPKLVQLLNIQESVVCLWFTLMSGAAEVIKHKSDIENLNQLALSKLDNLEKCRYILHLKSSINETEMENFLQFANTILLQVILMKPRAKHVCMIIKTKGWTLNKNLTHTIKILNKNELSYCNRDELKTKISSIVDSGIQTAKDIWCKTNLVRIAQSFHIERDYSV